MPEPKKKRILIADDDLAILDVLTLFLEECGYEVESTADGTCVPALARTFPDLLLLDIWMSGSNGCELCAQFKRQPNTAHLPVILISANKDTEHLAREAGADDFIAKPFDLDVVLSKIEHAL
ncbi:response regulator transcription factor [Ktedonosporobacter rubrisoli]|uniref:Response regulator transcription factor n=1 Tax=Ktedonosporobacter rubrisoli TaxID=2509675 RepID=A0A4P6JIQ9_KTERU|nr:response regulator [Ktedonosporobacter rubrisoli]QBD74883.1 response regulator transcription factor [Ktedonosporobacter rubrisoli]